MDASTNPHGFLDPPEPSPDGQRLLDDDLESYGYVMNLSRLWGHDPSMHDGLFQLLSRAVRSAGLTLRQRGVLVAACASELGDAYCSLAWGTKLAGEASAEVAAAVLGGSDEGLDDTERALARWARAVVEDPNRTVAADVDALRSVGFDDRQIFAITCFVACRLAFSTVNDALGTRPDAELVAGAPEAVRAAVSYGRPPVR